MEVERQPDEYVMAVLVSWVRDRREVSDEAHEPMRPRLSVVRTRQAYETLTARLRTLDFVTVAENRVTGYVRPALVLWPTR